MIGVESSGSKPAFAMYLESMRSYGSTGRRQNILTLYLALSKDDHDHRISEPVTDKILSFSGLRYLTVELVFDRFTKLIRRFDL
jgi:hypothetical protein